MTDAEKIEQLTEALNSIEEKLNEFFAETFGSTYGWSEHAGDIAPPADLLTLPTPAIAPEHIKALWLAREEANSVLDWCNRETVEA